MAVLVAGISDRPICGVRDHARVLSAALRDDGVIVTTLWLEAPPGLPDVTELGQELERRCQANPPDAVLLHYSVFTFSKRGIPAGVPRLAGRLRRLGVPVVLFAHEFAYPWGRRGWRGAVQAATQRVALVPLVRASAAVVVTTPERVHWLQMRRWLAGRPIGLAPVFSNVSPHPSARAVAPVVGRIGLFSFGAEGLAMEVVIGAVADIARRSSNVHLILIGAPGPNSSVAERWRAAAAAAGCPLSFTGVAEEAELSRQLAACEVVVFADPAGPSLRKTSLAAALAHGLAVVALDGQHGSGELLAADGVAVSKPTRAALANELARLLADDAARADFGRRGKAFYEAELAPERAALRVHKLLLTASGWRGTSAAQLEANPASTEEHEPT